jgi:hypothetical protein
MVSALATTALAGDTRIIDNKVQGVRTSLWKSTAQIRGEHAEAAGAHLISTAMKAGLASASMKRAPFTDMFKVVAFGERGTATSFTNGVPVELTTEAAHAKVNDTRTRIVGYDHDSIELKGPEARAAGARLVSAANKLGLHASMKRNPFFHKTTVTTSGKYTSEFISSVPSIVEAK